MSFSGNFKNYFLLSNELRTGNFWQGIFTFIITITLVYAELHRYLLLSQMIKRDYDNHF